MRGQSLAFCDASNGGQPSDCRITFTVVSKTTAVSSAVKPGISWRSRSSALAIASQRMSPAASSFLL